MTPPMQLSSTTAPLDPRALELRFSSTLAVDSLQARPRSKCLRARMEVKLVSGFTRGKMLNDHYDTKVQSSKNVKFIYFYEFCYFKISNYYFGINNNFMITFIESFQNFI